MSRSRHYGDGWLALWGALLLHVVEEAAHDFRAVYDPAVETIRRDVSLPGLPPFPFEAWIVFLVVSLVVLLALTLPAYRGARWLRSGAFVFSAVMFANGLIHIVGSLLLWWPVPGVLSSPLLIAGSVYLWIRLARS